MSERLRGDRRFDTIVAVHVGLFGMEPERAHALVEPWLDSNGSVVVFSDRPGGAVQAAR